MSTENEKNMEQMLTGEIDLGDELKEIEMDFDPFADLDDNPEDSAAGNSINTEPVAEPADAKTTTIAETAAVAEAITEEANTEKAANNNENTSDEQKAVAKGGEQGDFNPFEAEIDRAETKQAEETKTGLLSKPPVFEYAGASEEIEDLSKTFEDIRAAKAEDFPELEDAKRVSWKMNYCGIVKNIAQPKETTIAEQKKLIEESKDFATAIKRKKGEFVCKVIPTVTAQKKGQMPVYKGIFLDEDSALKSNKAIAYVPSVDGNMYEIRNNTIGTFRAKAERIKGLTRVKAGFTPALPLFPYNLLCEIIAFFRYFADRKNVCEALVNVYWDNENDEYVVKVPKQKVGTASVDTILPDNADDLVHVMDIHSHNFMKAFFSQTDDNDEKATRLYTVIGRLDKLFPDISTRISVGGKFVDIHPSDIFEYPFDDFPNEWLDNVTEYRAGGDLK
jgi:hypothetical protein